MDTVEFFPALIDALGVTDFTKSREFGRERGLNPTLSEMNKKSWDELVQRLNYSATKPKKGNNADDDEDAVTFDIKSAPRVILNKGYISTKSYNSIVPHNQRRYGYLLNDVFLITSPPPSGFSIFSEKLNIYHVIQLDSVSFIDLKLVNPSEDPCAFALRTAERPYHILAESETDKKIWLEELEAAIFCIYASTPKKQLGWNHDVLLGTIYSAAVLGEVDLLTKHISRLVGQSLDIPDESGMTALHWASLYGHVDAVQVLLDNGADLDRLNDGLNSALMIACSCGHENVALLLISRGADVTIRNMKGMDSLSLMVLYGGGPGLKQVVTALRIAGVDLNQMDSLGAAPLHEVAGMCHVHSVQVLIDAGADVNLKNGRTGLTPLQMACSAAEPDPITIECLLQRGAHPNWKDAAKRTGFDMILQTQRSIQVRMGGGHHSREDIQNLSDFVQGPLTSCIFLARRGARFTDETIQYLKPSFQEMLRNERTAWEKMTEHPHFVHYIEKNRPKQPRDMADNESDHCLLCVDKFTMSNRRHHCRGCGILVCLQCSTKRLCMTPVSKGGSSAKQDRVCDGCFNRFTNEAMKWVQSEKESARQQVEESVRNAEAELAANKAAADAAVKKKKSTLSIFYSEQSSSKSGKVSGGSGAVESGTSPRRGSAAMNATAVADGSSQLQTSLNDTRSALDERGQRLNDLAERTEQMNLAAGDFLANARKLKEQQKAAAWRG